MSNHNPYRPPERSYFASNRHPVTAGLSWRHRFRLAIYVLIVGGLMSIACIVVLVLSVQGLISRAGWEGTWISRLLNTAAVLSGFGIAVRVAWAARVVEVARLKSIWNEPATLEESEEHFGGE